MFIQKINKYLISTLTAIFIAVQVFGVPLIGLTTPKKADAFAILNVEVGNVYDIAKDIALGALKSIALKISQKFITKFTNKLVAKYKIRNYLYYDQVLTNYYLGNYLRDKISDPDLRRIYTLMEAGFVTGQPTGTNAPPIDPRLALIPQLKRAVTNLYIEQTGVDPNILANPPATMSTQDYLAQTQYYYFNNPGHTEANLRAQFGEFQSAATTAAQLEVIVGNGLKAGRFVGGTCDITSGGSVVTGGTLEDSFDPDTGAPTTIVTDNPGPAFDVSTPEKCAYYHGTWRPSALDQARSFIDNPTVFIDKYLTSTIQSQIDSNFDPNNFWAVIGSLLGSFLFNQFFLDKPNGVLNEDPRGYAPLTNNETQPAGDGIDIDGDGTVDGYDFTKDGQLDVCIYGGSAPACIGSAQASTSPDGGATGACAALLTQGATAKRDVVSQAMETVLQNSEVANLQANDGNISDFRDQVIEELISMGEEAARGHNGNCNSSANNLAIKVNNVIGEMYEVVREGRNCDDVRLSTIEEHVNPCRLPPSGYTGQWSYVGEGIRP